MSLAVGIAVVLVLVGVNAVFATSELALVSARRARLTDYVERGVKGAERARALAEDPQRFLPTVQVGITLVSVLEGSLGGAQFEGRIAPFIARIPGLRSVADELAFLLVVIVITFLMLVLGELVPKQLALSRPELLAIRLSGPIAFLSRVSAPAVWVLGRTSALVLRLIGAGKLVREGVSEEELRALLVESAEAGLIEPEERDMIGRLMRLADKSVRAIMTPRNELVWVERDAPRDALEAALRESAHSRLVVCDDGPDNPVGVLRGKDALDCLLDGGEIAVGRLMRQAVVLPDTITALDALERLRGDRLGLALVLDEYGSFEGVVTVADVMEAIVVDAVAPDGAREDTGAAPDDVLMLDGMTPVDEVKERLRLPDLPAAGSYHTLGGLVLALLRRVPATGDRIVFAGWLFEVVGMDGRRVDRVRASRERLAEE